MEWKKNSRRIRVANTVMCTSSGQLPRTAALRARAPLNPVYIDAAGSGIGVRSLASADLVHQPEKSCATPVLLSTPALLSIPAYTRRHTR